MTRFHFRLMVLASVLILALLPHLLSSFQITLLNYIGIYSLAAIGLVVLTGIGGMVSFGQAAFVGIAAYSTAWLTAYHGYSAWLGLPFAIVVTCAVATVLGLITLRLGGHFLSLSTLASGLTIAFLFGNLDGLGRFNGIPDIPPIAFGSYDLIKGWQIYYLIWAAVVLSLVLLGNLLESRLGRAIRLLRGGNTLVESVGINAYSVKLRAFIIAAFLAALSGWFYAHLSRYVSPQPFEASAGIEYLMMAMIGGAGSLIGGALGAGLVTFLKNAIQDYLPIIAKANSGQLEIVVFSAIFIVFLQRARRGIVPFVAAHLPKVQPIYPVTAPGLKRRDQPAPGTILLSIQDVEKRFGSLAAVNKVSFDVRAGEIVALIGPNGAGKTTMFNLITGALRIDGGDIRVGSQAVASKSQCKIAALGVARTFQHVKLRPNMTLLDNVLLGTYARTRGGLFRGLLSLNKHEEANARYTAFQQLQRVGLGDNPFELAGNLPLGKQRLLEIARALAADPKLLILDEPAAGLRKQEKQRLAELIVTLRTEHLTILLVEHDMEFVMGLVDRVIVMVFGCKLCEGNPDAIRCDERVQEAYLGDAS